MILWVIVAACAAWIVAFKYRRRRMYAMANECPRMAGSVPVFGMLHKFFGNTEDIMKQLQLYSYDTMKTPDRMISGWLGHILYFISVNPADLEVILKTCLEKDDLHRFMRKIIGYGGIFAPVPIWRRRRKILVPAFSPQIVQNFVEVFADQGQKLGQRLESSANGEQFSVWPFLSTYTLDSVCETAMGVKINTQDNSDSPFLLSLSTVLNLVCERIFKLWLQPDWMFKLFPQYREHQKCLHMMHSFTDEVIKNKRTEISKNEEKHTSVGGNGYVLDEYKKQTFLDLLITLSGGEKGYTNEELREETLTLAIAGTDTSATATGFILKLLAMNPDVQDKVYQELLDVFGDSDRPIHKDDLVKLEYMHRVVKESLRLYPPVPFIIRKVLEDIKLPSGKCLPAGSGVVVSIWGVHRDPKYWGPDAEKFDPDRFLPERFQNIHPCTYMPFSNGPRNCVGFQYAFMSMKIAVASILRHYRVIPDEESLSSPVIRVKLDIMMKAVDGFKIALIPR